MGEGIARIAKDKEAIRTRTLRRKQTKNISGISGSKKSCSRKSTKTQTFENQEN